MDTIQTLPPVPIVGTGQNLQPPDALTPEVMVFFLTICFLAIFGMRRSPS